MVASFKIKKQYFDFIAVFERFEQSDPKQGYYT